jgi:RNA polymerase sigma factor (sigma-70 family)
MKAAPATVVSEQCPQESFDDFFLRNYRKVYDLLYKLTGQKMEAEDLTVETFVRYLQRRPKKEDHPSAWLYRVAMNLGYNALRSSKRRTKYEEKAGLFLANGGASEDPEQFLQRERQKRKVRNILSKMSRRDAEMLLLYHSGFSYKEISQVINVAPASVGTLLIRAQKKFQNLYLE